MPTNKAGMYYGIARTNNKKLEKELAQVSKENKRLAKEAQIWKEKYFELLEAREHDQ